MKAVIPAAGLGTRFLPYTKSQPKEMIPVVDKPTIQYVVEEAIAAGLSEILIVTGRGKRAIEDHFDKNIELEAHLRSKGKSEALRELESLWKSARIHYVRQGEPLGLGHAIAVAESYVGDEPFACLLGDDVTVDRVPCIRQLMDVHRERGASVIAVQRVPKERMQRYGMILGEEAGDRLWRITDVVEKPKPEQVTSDLAAMGRYVFLPSIFDELRDLKPTLGGEIQLADGLRALARREDVFAYEYRGRRYDLGSKLDWILANVEFALGHKELGPDLRAALITMLGRNRSQ
jgi:UTP--glucose-1-phosphate uridylyltransferase